MDAEEFYREKRGINKNYKIGKVAKYYIKLMTEFAKYKNNEHRPIGSKGKRM